MVAQFFHTGVVEPFAHNIIPKGHTFLPDLAIFTLITLQSMAFTILRFFNNLR